ncbi:VOC family protein [Dysgonomonas sp. Marseille-P4677]|uniref:VOC family protein n=1 Tax=Dysgonomonas sp. Marseille-P4677 TaxID=2364790 RepID=UPI0019118203|nr:VOC family protein [Dysgonomonas sp. Marseille-P4677]MBK5720367.1 VOC family protein [Dysgonomonas sp. Marseille-P4677]
MATIQKIIPCLWFDHQAEEAVKFYTSLFESSKIGRIIRYTEAGQGDHQMPPGSVMTIEFTLDGQEFLALNGGPVFKFNEAVSFIINCDTQAEIDYYWDHLTADGGEEGVCGWLKDKFGVSWQVAPTVLNEMMADPDMEKVKRVTQAFLPMKKLDMAIIEKAYKGE